MNEYKLTVLVDMLHGLCTDNFYTVQVKGSDTKAINLDIDAVLHLIEFYQNRMNEN
jgi:hypothetical protein